MEGGGGGAGGEGGKREEIQGMKKGWRVGRRAASGGQGGRRPDPRRHGHEAGVVGAHVPVE